MANIRFTKEVSFDIDADLCLMEGLKSHKVAVLPNISIKQDAPIRIYIFDPAGQPLLIFDKVPYVDFVGMWSPEAPIPSVWQNFPCLELAAFIGPACFSTGKITVRSIVFLCIELADHVVINPSDSDGRIHDAIMAVLERHQSKPCESHPR